MNKKEFGFYPKPLEVKEGAITIRTLSGFDHKVKETMASDMVENDWIYAPYPQRVFSLHKTHEIEHTEATNGEHIDFHVWVLSFFMGFRLTTTDAGFVDATPIKPRKLTDFCLHGNSLNQVIRLAEDFWTNNSKKPRIAKQFNAAVHSLFLGKNPQSFQFEQFIYLYTAIDACYALAKEIKKLKRTNHGQRIKCMCKGLGINVPEWGVPDSNGGCEVSKIRNNTLHEALYEGLPLGFNINKSGAFGNLPLEMSKLICRLLVALIGGNDKPYLESPVSNRSIHGLFISGESICN